MNEQNEETTKTSGYLKFPLLAQTVNSDREYQRSVNESLFSEVKDQSDYLVRTMDSLGRAWTKIGALWIFAAGGYVTGIAGIVLAVTR